MATKIKRTRKRRALELFDSTLDYGLLSELTGFAIKRANVIDFASFGNTLDDKTVTPLRFSMLNLIGCNPGLQQVQLADALGLSRSATTVTIDYWDERGCVERRSDPADRRSYGIYLTDEGRTRLDRIAGLVAAHDKKFTENLTRAELVELRRLLAKLYMR
ncbi:MarR family winged helix-turn-helix transcriptional regulator [Parasphingopyxis marina]|uniref:MarR family transcriptional regulator n=1 Tax=Parasphingopyxis marina TaxID=2761622 RepID=A0A842HYS9_9SPHN|nr:MarR family transcriptional regulator [Parasphingopyxis marina]MBC2777509.1 MarR family transcriptional regulator [Parasphingopyxis marina]